MKAPKKLTSKEQRARGDLRTKWLAPDREWLEYHYVELEKSRRRIAYEIGAHHSGEIVKRWLVLLGVPVRKWSPDVPSEKVLRFHYETLGRSACELARRAAVDVNTVLGWLDIRGVPRRSRAEAYRLTREVGHCRWIGGGRRYARWLKTATGAPKICELCGSDQKVIVHHKDGNKNNNELDNLQYLCRSCHVHVHRSTCREKGE